LFKIITNATTTTTDCCSWYGNFHR
jgi:hypothetical protein